MRASQAFIHPLAFPQVGSLEDGVSVRIEAGRPAVKTALTEFAEEHSALPSVGVFAAGPASLTREVRHACIQWNDRWRTPYCDFSSHAFDL